MDDLSKWRDYSCLDWKTQEDNFLQTLPNRRIAETDNLILKYI